MSGHVLGIWICGCSLFYKRELRASKSAGAHSTKKPQNQRVKKVMSQRSAGLCTRYTRAKSFPVCNSVQLNLNFQMYIILISSKVIHLINSEILWKTIVFSIKSVKMPIPQFWTKIILHREQFYHNLNGKNSIQFQLLVFLWCKKRGNTTFLWNLWLN